MESNYELFVKHLIKRKDFSKRNTLEIGSLDRGLSSTFSRTPLHSLSIHDFLLYTPGQGLVEDLDTTWRVLFLKGVVINNHRGRGY